MLTRSNRRRRGRPRRRHLLLVTSACLLSASSSSGSAWASSLILGDRPHRWTLSPPPPLSGTPGDAGAFVDAITADDGENDHDDDPRDPHPTPRPPSLLDAALDRLLANVVTEEVMPREHPRPHSLAEDAEKSDDLVPSEEDEGGGASAGQVNASSPSAPLARFTYVSPCSPPPSDTSTGGVRYVQESTSSLLSARALAKSGRSDLAWSILDSLFSVQAVNGFVPRYRFSSGLLPSNDDQTDPIGAATAGGGEDMDDGYVPGGYYANSTLFGLLPFDYLPPSDSVAALGGILGSGRISAPPLHATVALEIFYLSEQTDYDLEKMEENFVRLTRWHSFLHDSGVGSIPPDGVLDPSASGTHDPPDDSSTGWTTEDEEEAELGGDGEDEDDDGGELGGWSRHHNREPDAPLPLYNVIHPWESEIAMNSPLWRSVLRPVIERMHENGWHPARPTPERVRRRGDYPGDEVYDAMLYLLDCISNVTNRTATATITYHPPSSDGGIVSSDGDDTTELRSAFLGQSTRSYEGVIVSQCQFAMLDVGYAAALAKADGDMLAMAQILRDKNSKFAPSKADSVRLARWSERSSASLRGLWDDGDMMYLPKLLVVNESANATDADDDDHVLDVTSEDDDARPGNRSHRRRPTYGMVPVDVPVADDFVALFGGSPVSDRRPSRVDSVTFHLLQREGRYSFDCGRYPVWTVGGCGGDGDDYGRADRGANGTRVGGRGLVSPALNYFISRGLDQNGGSAFGHYVRNSTLNLVCGLPNTEGVGWRVGALYDNRTEGICPSYRNSTSVLPFARYYDGRTGRPVGGGDGTDEDECDGMTFTLTAAVIYDAMVPDGEFTYTFAPPISNVWVLVLITCELSIAFGIGVSCIVLSLNLMRRLKADDDRDVFVRLIRDQRVDLMDLYGDSGIGGGGESSMSMEDGAGGGGLMYGSASSSLGGGHGSSDADFVGAEDGSFAGGGEGTTSLPGLGCPSQRGPAEEVMGFWDYARPYRENLNPFRLFGAARPHPHSSAE